MQWRGAPTRTAHAAVARKRSPARSCMMMSETPLPTLALGRSAKRALHQAFRAARSARCLQHPHHQEATRALSAGAHAGARAHSAHAIGAERAARGRDWALPQAPGRAAPTPSAPRARSAWRRWQPAAAPPGTQARSALGAQRRAPSAERVARGGDQARRRRRALCAHTTGAERVARGGASWHAVAQPATLGGFCLC